MRGRQLWVLFGGILLAVVAVGIVFMGDSRPREGVVVTDQADGGRPPKAPRKPPRPPRERPTEPFALTDASVPGFPDFRSSGAQLLKLDELAPASLSLPAVEPLGDITDEFVVDHEEMPNPQGKARKLKVLRAKLPFPIELDEQTFKPDGMDVTIDGQLVEFSRTPAPKATKSTWRITGKHLILSHPSVPAPGAVKVYFDRVQSAIEDHDPAKAPRATYGEPAFLRWQLTLGGMTRHGLTLVAPTKAEWDVKLPETKATFEGWLALERPPLDEPASDGAAVSLVVVDGGKETVVDRQQLTSPSAQFVRWRADLTPWAGKQVRLRIATDPMQSPVFDWVFLGSPTVWGPPKDEVRRVVVVALDTTRADHLSLYGYPRPTTPEIDRWAKTGVVFERAWSTAPRTRPSFRSSTTGYLPLEAVDAANIAEVFDRNGFATAGFVANVHLQPRFDFDQGFDSWWFDGKARADQEVDRALGWLNDNVERDAYLFVHIMDPHMAYDAPGEWKDKFVTDPDPTLPAKVQRSDVVRWMTRNELTEQRKKHLHELHLGELAYTSNQLGRFFAALDELPGKTLVVLHSDHGEEFWEHGGFEHNHTLFDELTHTVLAMRPAGGLPKGRREAVPTSLMDIAPTLYDLFGLTDAPKTDGQSLVPLLAGVGGTDQRPLPVGYLQYSHERWGVVYGGHKYILHTGSGQEELYDLENDPGETKDLAADADLEPYRQQLGKAHQIPVGPGFRVRVDLEPNGEPLEITLPAPAKLAGVLDPETVVEHRANLEWGEKPQRVPDDIGKVELAEDRKSLVYTPGPKPQNGILYVLFDAPQGCEGVTATRGGSPLALAGCKWQSGRHSVVVDPGTVVIPPLPEAVRMGLASAPAAGSGDDLAELCALGYVTEGCDELDDPH